MRPIILTLTLAASVFLPAAASAQECLSSPVAVRAAHGQQAWSTYKTVNGRKCWMEGERPDGRSNVSRDGAHNRSARSGAVREARKVTPLPPERIVPTKVKAVPIPPLAWPDVPTPKTTGVATVKVMASAWNDGFDALADRPALIPPVVVPSPPKPIAAAVMPLRPRSSLRSDWRTEAMHLLAALLALITVIGLGAFLVGEIHGWLRTREARR